VAKAWTEAQRKKFKATMKAKAKARHSNGAAAPAIAKPEVPHQVKDAIIYLSHARTEMNQRLTKGTLKRMGREHLLMLLALDCLEG
jgi:hypothetical protein